MSEKNTMGAWNEWGKLRQAALGYVDDLAEPEYIPALIWLSDEGKKALRSKAGKLTR